MHDVALLKMIQWAALVVGLPIVAGIGWWAYRTASRVDYRALYADRRNTNFLERAKPAPLIGTGGWIVAYTAFLFFWQWPKLSASLTRQELSDYSYLFGALMLVLLLAGVGNIVAGITVLRLRRRKSDGAAA
jgi:hypothetical protein